MQISKNRLAVAALALLVVGGGVFLYITGKDGGEGEPRPGSETTQLDREEVSGSHKDVLSKDMVAFIEADAGDIVKNGRGAEAISSIATVSDVKSLLDGLADKGVTYNDVVPGDTDFDIVVQGLNAGGMTIEKLTINRPNLEAIKGLAAGNWAGETPVFAQMKMETVASDTPANADIAGDAFQARTVEIGTSTLLLPALGDKDAEEGERSGGAVVADFIDGLSVDGLVIEGMSLTMADYEGNSSNHEIGDFRLGALGGGTLKHLAVRDYKSTDLAGLKAPPDSGESPADGAATYSFSRLLASEGFTVSGLLPYLKSGKAPARTERGLIRLGQSYFGASASYVNDAIVMEIPSHHSAPIEFVGLVPETITIPPVTSKLFIKTFFETPPAVFTGVLLFAGVPKEEREEQIAQIGETLKSYDLFEIVNTSTGMDWRYDAKTQGVDLDLQIGSPQLADLGFTFDLTQVPLHDLISAGLGLEDEATSENLNTLTQMNTRMYNALEIKITDYQLVPLIFDIAALNFPGTGSQLRASAPLAISLQAAALAEKAPQITEFAEAISAFISKGGTLTVKMSPETPMTTYELMGAFSSISTASVERTGLEITHTE